MHNQYDPCDGDDLSQYEFYNLKHTDLDEENIESGCYFYNAETRWEVNFTSNIATEYYCTNSFTKTGCNEYRSLPLGTCYSANIDNGTHIVEVLHTVDVLEAGETVTIEANEYLGQRYVDSCDASSIIFASVSILNECTPGGSYTCQDAVTSQTIASIKNLYSCSDGSLKFPDGTGGGGGGTSNCFVLGVSLFFVLMRLIF